MKKTFVLSMLLGNIFANVSFAVNPGSVSQDQLNETVTMLRSEIATSSSSSGNAAPIGPSYSSTCSQPAGNCLIFTTAANMQGDMTIAGDNFFNITQPGSGITGANSICQQEGDARFGAGKSWYAWLSTSSSAAGTDVYQADKHYISQSGSFIAYPGTLLTRLINIIVPGVGTVWTGTNADGTTNPNRCNDWIDDSILFVGLVGAASEINNNWTVVTSSACDIPRKLYCFER